MLSHIPPLSKVYMNEDLNLILNWLSEYGTKIILGSERDHKLGPAGVPFHKGKKHERYDKNFIL